jgi:hypothetical protein
MNKFSNILKLPKSTNYSQDLLKKIERKINDHNKIEEKEMNEVKRADILYNQIEYPQRIIIEPDFKKINTEKYFESIPKDENNSNKYIKENQLEKESLENVEFDIEAKEEEKENKILAEDIENEEKEFTNQEKTNEIVKVEELKFINAFKSKSIFDIKESDKFIVLTLNVLDYFPKNIVDFCAIFCPECQER